MLAHALFKILTSKLMTAVRFRSPAPVFAGYLSGGGQGL
jgi:hypothetical protein